MSSWTSFGIVVCGPEAQLAELQRLMRSLTVPDTEAKGTWGVDLTRYVGEQHDGQDRYWTQLEDCCYADEGKVHIEGEMPGAPPLRFLAAIAPAFSNCVFDVFSETEHEWNEHWRVQGDLIELIEERIVNLQNGAVEKYYLKLSDEPRFAADAQNGIDA